MSHILNSMIIRCFKILRRNGKLPPRPKGFEDTVEDLAWLDDDDGSKMQAACDKLKTDGYEPAPYDHLPDQSAYEYAFYGPLLYLRARVER